MRPSTPLLTVFWTWTVRVTISPGQGLLGLRDADRMLTLANAGAAQASSPKAPKVLMRFNEFLRNVSIVARQADSG